MSTGSNECRGACSRRGLAFVAAVLLAQSAANAQELSLIVNPRTGDVEIRNSTNSSINFDGYLLTALEPRFNVAQWDSLVDASTAGWFEGQAADNRLGEVNLLSFSTIGPGASIPLGSPYMPFAPTQIGQLEPEFQFEYHLHGGDTVVGEIVFAPQNNLVLVVDPSSGAAALQNQSNFDVTIDGYLLKSSAGVLQPGGWSSLTDSGAGGGGWAESHAATNRLGELNLLSSKLLAANGAPVPLGSPINPAAIGSVDELVLEYHIAGVGTVQGSVVFAAATAPVPGDYNQNGNVDAADYTIWRDTLGSTTDLRANGDNNGASADKVDGADYAFWKSQFGAGASVASGLGAFAASPANVPEPSAGAIACLAGVMLAVRHRFTCVRCTS